jgi:RHS repeat-associated protein
MPSDTIGDALRFKARELDPTGLYYMRARYYDPALLRFISQDPSGDMSGGNAYAFVRNDPVNLSDPSGLCSPGEDSKIVFSQDDLEQWHDWRECLGGDGWRIDIDFGVETWAGRNPFAMLTAVSGAMSADGELTGIEGLGRGAQELAGGGIGTGMLTVALSLPIIPGESEALSIAKRFTPDQAALIGVAKWAKRLGGVSAADADVLRKWAEEYGVLFRGPEAHPGRAFGQYPHIHVGPIDHIPFWP